MTGMKGPLHLFAASLLALAALSSFPATALADNQITAVNGYTSQLRGGMHLNFSNQFRVVYANSNTDITGRSYTANGYYSNMGADFSNFSISLNEDYLKQTITHLDVGKTYIAGSGLTLGSNNTFSVVSDGIVSSGNTGIVNGGTVWNSMNSEATTRANADTALSNRLGVLANDGGIIKSLAFYIFFMVLGCFFMR